MRLDQLNYIIAISNAGSISVAAEKLGVSQPCVSQAVIALEEELGTKIFIRAHSGVTPTESGRKLIKKAQEILCKVEEFKYLAEIEPSQLTGRIVIGAVQTLALVLLPRTILSIKSRFPKVELEIAEENSPAIISGVFNGSIDLGLLALTDLGEYRQLKLTPFLSSPIMACVGKNSPLASRKSVKLKELLDYPIIGNSSVMIHALKKHGQPNLLYRSRTMESNKAVIADNQAVGFFTELALKFDPYVYMGEIIPLKIEDEETVLEFCMLESRQNYSVISQEVQKELMLQLPYIRRIYGPQ